ncbi:MAG: ABC transporter permease [Candidatus Aminicenantes bacterium]|nr:MAG: ABC transporter permease [Candidatus Aminicenantes bacterium]
MFKNYVKIAARNLYKQKAYSLINIFGLAIAIAFCILILLFVRDEVTHDSFHKKADRLYRVIILKKQDDGSMQSHAMTPPPLGPALKEEFPEVAHMARFKKRGDVVVYQGKSFRESITLAEPDFFKMFSFPLIYGDPQTILQDRNSVVLREEVAKNYFGDEDPIGKILSIKMGSRFYDFTVSGIAGNIPGNSSITFDFLVSFDRVKDYTPASQLNQWLGFTTLTFIELQGNVIAADLEQKFPGFIKKYMGQDIEKYLKGDYSAFQMDLQPLEDIYLNTRISSSYQSGSNPIYSYILSGIAFLILIIAAINYMNLAIARSTIRLREIGVRKVLGASRKKLMHQFLGESLFFSFISLSVGIVLAELFLPAFNNFAGKTLSIQYLSDWTTLSSLVVLMLFVGFSSGSYPALFLSSFRPAEVFRSHLRIGGKSKFSKGLVVVQFILSVFLIICTLIMTQQLSYLQNRNLGFKGEQVVIMPTHGSAQGTLLVDRFRNELASFADVKAVAGSVQSLGNDRTYIASPVRFEKKQVMSHYFLIDYDFLETVGLQIVEGRDFLKEFTADPKESVIVNESLVNEMGWDSASGKKIKTFMGRKDPLTVVGVVKDFHFESLHNQIKPAIFYIEPRWQQEYIYVKISPVNIPSSLRLLEDMWKKNAPNFPFMYSFLDDEFQKLYRAEKRWSTIIRYSSFFAILISCLGLFGLSALSIARRTKEIGIRKVLGASVQGLASMMSLDFLKLVIFANVLSWPLAYYVMSRWLRSFAFRIDIKLGVFLLAAVIAAAIALLTVGLQAVKAAVANPVESLRYE